MKQIIAYCCDGEVENCKDSKGCFKNGGQCCHTCQIDHAINFEKVDGSDEERYLEMNGEMGLNGYITVDVLLKYLTRMSKHGFGDVVMTINGKPVGCADGKYNYSTKQTAKLNFNYKK